MKLTPNIVFIRKLMSEKNMTLRDLARKAEVSAAAISNVFNGKRGAGKVLIGGFIKAFPKEQLNELFFLSNVSSNDEENNFEINMEEH